MSVFISWAEKDSFSHKTALLLKDWLPDVLQHLECFVASEDIGSGELWLPKLFEQLDKSETGILCLTKQSMDTRWMLFEAGALAKRVGKDILKVCPLLLKIKPSELSLPLTAFQHRVLNKDTEEESKKQMFQLLEMLNKSRSVESRLIDIKLQKQCGMYWPEFWKEYLILSQNNHPAKKSPHPAHFPPDDFISEVRGTLRQIAIELSEMRRLQPEQIPQQEFTAQCPVCEKSIVVSMPDRPGETKPVVCDTCRSRFNVHVKGPHPAFVRLIEKGAQVISTISAAPPTLIETVNCPQCQEILSVEISDEIGSTRTIKCSNCNTEVNIHRLETGKIYARVENKLSTGTPTGIHLWQFLKQTDAWVRPEMLFYLVPLTIQASSEKSDGEALTPDSLCKRIFLRMDAGTPAGINRTVVRYFIKLLFLGRAFKFPDDTQTTFRAPFTNALDEPTIIQAFARGVIGRLRGKFDLTVADLPELRKLFPVEMAGFEEALLQALAESKDVAIKT